MNEDAQIALVARQAASRLASGFAPNLLEDVEQALAADPLDQPAKKVLDPISIGALIVSVAALGWTIYHDLKKDREASNANSSEDLAEKLKDQWAEVSRGNSTITEEQQDNLLMVISTEIVAVDTSSSRR